jgi:hypothetical protein
VGLLDYFMWEYHDKANFVDQGVLEKVADSTHGLVLSLPSLRNVEKNNL